MDKEKDAANRCSKRRILCVNYIQSKEIKTQQKKFLNVIKTGIKIRRKKDEVVLERYHGLGNDYLVFDPNHNELELDQANVKMICDRNEGLALTEFWKDRS